MPTLPLLLLLEEPSSPSAMRTLFPLVAMGLIFWFILIRPQMKEQSRRKSMLRDLKKNDEVMTQGGLYGRIVKIDDERVTLQVADGVRMRFSRQAVQGLVGEPAKEDEASA